MYNSISYVASLIYLIISRCYVTHQFSASIFPNKYRQLEISKGKRIF